MANGPMTESDHMMRRPRHRADSDSGNVLLLLLAVLLIIALIVWIVKQLT